MITKIYKSFIFSVAMMGLSSCVNNWLDQAPSNGIPTSQAITNYNDARTAMYGMYDGLQGNSTYSEYYAARMFYYGDVRADDMQARDQGMRTSSCYEMRYTVDDAPAIWNVPYNVIRRANRIIEAVDNKKILDAEKYQKEVNDIYAQAKVVRALVHFDLVRIYGNPYTSDKGASLGVPFVDTALGTDSQLGRETVASVYEKVIKDLTDAVNSGALYKSEKVGEKQGFIDQWAAEALLTRVYLYKGENELALSTAQNIIEHSPYKLWEADEYAEAWDKMSAKHTKEMMFELINNGTDDWADREGIGYLYNEDGYADAICTKSFVDMLKTDKNDVRINVILPVQNKMDDKGSPTDLYKKYGDEPVFINKFPKGQQGDPRLQNLPILRLSEVYLNAAEAAMKIGGGNVDYAVKYLNDLIKARSVDVNSANVVDAGSITLERVLTERRKELVGEGHRFFDAMRNNETIVRYESQDNIGWHYALNEDSRKFDRTYFRAILPIPVSEVNANPVIAKQQNPGY